MLVKCQVFQSTEDSDSALRVEMGSHHAAGLVKQPDAGSFFHWGIHSGLCAYFDLAQVIYGDIAIDNFAIYLNHALTNQLFCHPP